MAPFRTISYPKMLYEALRNYYSVNTSGNMSILFRYMAAIVAPLISPWNAYDVQRRQSWLIAQCKWEVGQLTNVLNYIYDTTLQRIYITQSTVHNVGAPKFPYPTTLQARKFGEDTPAQGRKFHDSLSTRTVVFNIPSTVSVAAISATIEQIRLQGIGYTINVIP